MDASIVLKQIRKKGLVISPAGPRISIKPKKLLDERMIAFIQANKSVLLTALYQEQDEARMLHQKRMHALHAGRLHVLKVMIQRHLRLSSPGYAIPTDAEVDEHAGSALTEHAYDLENAIKTYGSMVDLYYHAPWSAVTCDACEHFIADPIGDGAGIGRCERGIEWTHEPSGKLPLFRFAPRHCSRFSKAMD